MAHPRTPTDLTVRLILNDLGFRYVMIFFSVSVELSEMASPPVISAPTLVTSTNQAATAGHSQAGHAQAGHFQAGHSQTGHFQAGHSQAGHSQAGHTQAGHAQAGHAQAGHAQAGHAQAVMATPSVIPSQNDNDVWHFKYLEAKGNYRKLKSQKREQAKKSRQLIVAVKNKLQDEDNEKMKVNSLHRMKCRNRYPLHRLVSQIIFKKICKVYKVDSVPSVNREVLCIEVSLECYPEDIFSSCKV